MLFISLILLFLGFFLILFKPFNSNIFFAIVQFKILFMNWIFLNILIFIFLILFRFLFPLTYVYVGDLFFTVNGNEIIQFSFFFDHHTLFCVSYCVVWALVDPDGFINSVKDTYYFILKMLNIIYHVALLIHTAYRCAPHIWYWKTITINLLLNALESPDYVYLGIFFIIIITPVFLYRGWCLLFLLPIVATVFLDSQTYCVPNILITLLFSDPWAYYTIFTYVTLFLILVVAPLISVFGYSSPVYGYSLFILALVFFVSLHIG